MKEKSEEWDETKKYIIHIDIYIKIFIKSLLEYLTITHLHEVLIFQTIKK